MCNLSTVEPVTATSLRETKKAATRLALARAVLGMATRDGIDGVTIDAVAAEAGVSVRTFHNYFSGKEDALVYFATALFDSIVERIESRPVDESFWQSVRFALVDVATATPDLGEPAEFATLLRLLDSEPLMTARSRHVDLIGQIEQRVAALIVDRGHSTSALYPHLVLHGAIAAAHTALEFLVTRTDPNAITDRATVRDTLNASLDQIESGLAQPIPRLKEQ